MIELLGTVAGLCTTVAILPQIYKSFKTKKTADISPVMYSILVFGLGLWCIYGIIKDDVPLIIFNGLGVAFNATLLVLYFKYKDGK